MRDSGTEWWTQALDLTLRAQRLRRQFFRHVLAAPAQPAWEPPVDILEAAGVVEVTVALPGVRADDVNVALEHDVLCVRALRRVPLGPVRRAVHRLEIPYGVFARRVALPPGRYVLAAHVLEQGCLRIALQKRGVNE